MERCDRPGCQGVIEDGYCNQCGLAPLGVTPAAATVAPSAGPSTPLSSRSGAARSTPSRSVSGRSIPAFGTASRSTPSGRSGRSARSSRSAPSRSSRAFGGSLIARPPLPPQDPIATLVPGVVPERKRYCSNCEAKLSRDAGFCPKCGQEYSFIPTLQPGDVVAGKYEIQGTIAFGGLGWIYLALDTVLSRWVVLKGLLNSKDANMVALAVKEREFLAAVKHRSIVGIYDFITHGNEGFIVMEYVNGKTLMTLRKERGEPLPVIETISYILDVLPAFGYLADMGLVYCDFKPENAMVEGEEVKLIDMGAVRQLDDLGGDIYGTKGYAAPEASRDPTPVSDLYSVARALAVLIANFDFQNKFEHELPPPTMLPVFQQYESLHRWLLKATRRDPAARFQSADEMGEQLVGVLREVAIGQIDLSQVKSKLFDGDGDLGGDLDSAGLDGHGAGWQALPSIKVDMQDSAASVLLAAAVVTEPARRLALFDRALTTYPDSFELKLRTVNEQIKLGAFDDAEQRLTRLDAGGGPADWQIAWYRGQLRLAQGRAHEALAAFQAVHDEIPGELAPKLALARAYELLGDGERALYYYDLVSRADPAYTSAAFGVARCLRQRGDRDGAAAAFQRVPTSSSRYARAQVGLVQTLLAPQPGPPGLAELSRASAAIEGLGDSISGLERHQLGAQVLRQAAALVEARAIAPSPSVQILKTPLLANRLRLGAEQELRACARFVNQRAEKIRLIDEANRVRPLTVF